MLVLLRSSTLALAFVCLALGLHLLTALPLRWTWVGAIALICIAGGALLVLRPRMRPPEVARRLDRRFRLGEQLSTALEVGAEADGVGAYLHDHARRTMAQIRRQVAVRQRFPWAELALVLALAMLLAGMLLLSGIGATPPGVAAEPLPPLAAAPNPSERFPEEPFQPPPAPQPGPGDAPAPGPGDTASVAALADALRDQSVTRPAAEALDQGDVGAAAASLRELAGQAGELSDQARSDLAESLRQAADQIAQSNPALAEQLRESADGLAEGDQQAAAALENLADAVEQLGQGQQPGEGAAGEGAAGEGQGEGQGQGGAGAGQGSLPGEQREGNPADRLGVDGVPLELESDGPGNTPTQGNPDGPTAPGGGSAGGGGFSSGSPSAAPVEIGDDPLRIPADLRDVVQDYFSP